MIQEYDEYLLCTLYVGRYRQYTVDNYLDPSSVNTCQVVAGINTKGSGVSADRDVITAVSEVFANIHRLLSRICPLSQ